jgi:hypothetical protein
MNSQEKPEVLFLFDEAWILDGLRPAMCTEDEARDKEAQAQALGWVPTDRWGVLEKPV